MLNLTSNKGSIILTVNYFRPNMTRREVIKTVLDGKKPPYTPWSFKFTVEAKEMLVQALRDRRS